MNVGIITSNNYPTDREVRTRKIAKSLDQNGDEVYILCRNTTSDPARGEFDSDIESTRESLDYATVLRFSWFKGTPVFDMVTAPLPFNPLWILWIVVTLWREDIDVMVGTNLRAGPAGIIASKLLGRPVIVDIQENHVELAKRLPKETIFDNLAHNPKVISSIEQFIYKFADEIWVVTEERREVMGGDVANSGRVCVVRNVPYLQELNEYSAQETLPSFDWPGFTLVYVGVLNDFRGLDLILKALADDATSDEVSFAIGGEGPYRDTLEATASRLGISDRVFFEGWIDSENVPRFLESGDVGVIPHEVNAFTNTTVPNKLFDMMIAGLPILATNMKPVEHVIEDVECGTVVPPDETAVAKAIEDFRFEEDLNQMGQNGRGAVRQQYNWETASESMISSVYRVGGNSDA